MSPATETELLHGAWKSLGKPGNQLKRGHLKFGAFARCSTALEEKEQSRGADLLQAVHLYRLTTFIIGLFRIIVTTMIPITFWTSLLLFYSLPSFCIHLPTPFRALAPVFLISPSDRLYSLISSLALSSPHHVPILRKFSTNRDH